MDRRRRRCRKIAAFSMIMLSWLQWQMGMFAPLYESDGDAVEGDDGYSFQFSGRSSYFIGLTMFQLLGVLLSQPEFVNALPLVKRAPRFWSAPRCEAIWDTQFLRTFQLAGQLYPNWEDDQYGPAFPNEEGCILEIASQIWSGGSLSSNTQYQPTSDLLSPSIFWPKDFRLPNSP